MIYLRLGRRFNIAYWSLSLTCTIIYIISITPFNPNTTLFRTILAFLHIMYSRRLAIWAGNTGWFEVAIHGMAQNITVVQAKGVALGYWTIDLSGCRHQYQNRPLI